MKIFWVIKAKTVMLCLIVCFTLLLVMYSWSYAATVVFPWGNKQVVFMGHVFDPKSPNLEDQVARLTENITQSAIDAEHDSVNKSVIPDINGFEIDIAETVAKIRSAKKGSKYNPSLEGNNCG